MEKSWNHKFILYFLWEPCFRFLFQLAARVLVRFIEKVQVGKDQEKAQSERNSRRGKTKLTIRCLYLENIS